MVVAVAVASVGGMPQASAQTARDAAKDHVNRELDKKKQPRKPSSTRRGGDERQPDDPDSGDGTTYTVDFEDPELRAQRGKTLPRRLLSGMADYLQLDLQVDGAYLGWLPQQYDSAEVDVASYGTWRAGVRGRFFKRVSLYRSYYESNGLSTPRNQAASIAAKVGGASPKAAKALAFVGLSFWKWVHPIVRYEAQSYTTVARPKIPLCIVGRNDSVDDANCPRTMSDLEVVSSFETMVAGVRIVPETASRTIFATQDGKLPPVYVGLGLMSYGKPYQITIDGQTLEEFLFDGRFRGAGLALGTELGGGARRFFGGVDVQLGLGEVQLTDDFTLNEVTPDDWLIGYVQGNLRAGYQFVVFDGPPTIYFQPMLSAGGASFHYVDTSGESSSTPTVNWDFLWSARACLVLTL